MFALKYLMKPLLFLVTSPVIDINILTNVISNILRAPNALKL